MDEPKKLLVIAQTYQCYKYWCIKNNLNPKGKEARYISSSQDLRGYDPNRIIIVHVCDWYRTKRDMVDIVAHLDMFRQIATGTLEERRETC